MVESKNGIYYEWHFCNGLESKCEIPFVLQNCERKAKKAYHGLGNFLKGLRNVAELERGLKR
jgi:hypothetical protein